MELMFAPLRKYVDFQGRARRSEYWLFVLFQIVVLGATLMLGMLMAGGNPENTVAIIPYYIALLVLFLPSLAVSVRRMHDTNRSGWWVLISLVPFIGIIWYLVLTVLDGTPGRNTFGADPKARGDSDTAQIFS